MTNFKKLNNKNVLTVEGVNYALAIISSPDTEDQKANDLYNLCSEKSLADSIDIFQHLGLNTEALQKILNKYREYKSNGYFERHVNPYKCRTEEEIYDRLEQLEQAYLAMNSDKTDHQKAEVLVSLYENVETFRKKNSLFVKYGSKDKRLDCYRNVLGNYELILSKFQEYERQGIVSDVLYIHSISHYIANYPYAKFIISSYIEDDYSYRMSNFLDKYGLDKDAFSFCVETISEVDYQLYMKYLEKKKQNKEVRTVKIKSTIASLATGIKTGYINGETHFDVFEFIRRIPFKSRYDFLECLIDFMNRNNINDSNTILKYIYSNGLDQADAFTQFDFNKLSSVSTTVYGVKITDEINNQIAEYLKLREVPLSYKTYLLGRDAYLKGNITEDILKELRRKFAAKGKVKTKCIIIP